MVKKCDNCGCYNEPKLTGWEMVEHSSGGFKYPEMNEVCPACGTGFRPIPQEIKDMRFSKDPVIIERHRREK